MRIDSDLDEVRLTLSPKATVGGSLFFLPFALAGTLFFSIGAVILVTLLATLVESGFGGLFAEGVLGFIGTMFCLVGGAHATLGWTNLAAPYLRLHARIDPHQVQIQRSFGPITWWKKDIPLSALDRVTSDEDAITLHQPAGPLMVGTRSFRPEDVSELAILLDQAAHTADAGSAPEEIHRLLGRPPQAVG